MRGRAVRTSGNWSGVRDQGRVTRNAAGIAGVATCWGLDNYFRSAEHEEMASMAPRRGRRGGVFAWAWRRIGEPP